MHEKYVVNMYKINDLKICTDFYFLLAVFINTNNYNCYQICINKSTKLYVNQRFDKHDKIIPSEISRNK